MSATLKELRAHLVAAKTALSAGNLAAARESCKSALGVDDESYEAWTFDGKVAFASGDATGALESYNCLLYTSPSPRDATLSRMPSSA